MFLGILTLITALSISAVAIYYSVAGLVAIFAAAAIPIMIMGTTLEIAKLVTAVWLHYYWQKTKWWLRSYLSLSVLVLMFITSMGIFGFLSSAHIEQTANAQEGLAQIERIDIEISRQQAVIDRSEERILDIESNGSSNDAEIQQQINTEQQRIDSAYLRIQPAIDEQLAFISKAEQDLNIRVQPLLDQAATIETTLANLSTALANNEIRVAQGIVGARQDGTLGPNTSASIQTYREAEEAKRNAFLLQVEQIRTTPQPTIESARVEITRLRNIAEQQIANSDQLIARLRDQLGTEDTVAVDIAVAEQQQVILEANTIIDTLTENKYMFQAEYRKLEAEVGPIKYIAEFVYGDSSDKDLLEEAVRWVIIIIIFVFDPLAVLLLIASQHTFELVKKQRSVEKRKEDDTHNRLDAIDPRSDRTSEEHRNGRAQDSETNNINGETETDGPMPRTGYEGRSMALEQTTLNELIEQTITSANATSKVTILEHNEMQLDADEQARKQQIDEIELLDDVKLSKQKWKEDNPDQNIKFWKDQYIKGKVDDLPWTTGYIQNHEQNGDSLWQRIRSKDE